MLFGWYRGESDESALAVARLMSVALRVHQQQIVDVSGDHGLAIGVFRNSALDGEGTSEQSPVMSDDGRYTLWTAGEAFSWDGERLASGHAWCPAVRQRMLHRLVAEGGDAIRELDGEYQIALWDRQERVLTLYTDRFSALPLYWANTKSGFAFAGGVRGVLMAPGVECRPDVDAIREAVTFGGYRLGSRTNISGVAMAPPAAALTIRHGRVAARRYWSWTDAPTPVQMPPADRLRRTRESWQGAIELRLAGSGRPGLLLSGGLDSRAILAEASRQCRGNVSAVSYGVPSCDDARYARRAARAAGAQWHLFPLFEAGWLERRISHIHATDGLINLVDLMHLEVLPQLRDHMDVYLSGYLGDLVSGSTYFDVETADDLLSKLPYYGGILGMPLQEARGLAERLLASTEGHPRFALYDHKLAQAINRVTEAARPWLRVRRPFVDYAFWSQAYQVPASLRRGHYWHEHWLRTTYPALFARIPNQRTGVPPGASRLRHQLTRTVRYGARQILGAASRAGLPVDVPQRSYHPDWEAWRQPDVRSHITDAVVGPGSLVAEVFGRAALADTLNDYFERDGAPSQVVGALFVYEHYHRALPGILRQWRAEGTQQ